MPFRLRLQLPGKKPIRDEDPSVPDPLAQEPRGAPPSRLVTSQGLVLLSNPHSAAAEMFRRLRTSIVTPQVMVVTSAAPREGKSLIAANLALAFAAEKDASVVLVDGDLRRPSVDAWLDPAPRIGLSEILSGEAQLEDGLLSLRKTALWILPAGRQVHDPFELLGSERAKSVIGALRLRFQRVIVDTAPILAFADANVLAGMGDGVFLVARSGVTPKAAFLRALSMVN